MKNISVLLATFNRAEILRQTLTNFTQLELTHSAVEIVIIDNNSEDNTREIVELFQDRLPLVYLFEPRPGKNCALNKALNEIDLGDVVIFTDDDVKPHKNWFRKINEVSNRWPQIQIFGGKVYMEWPPGSPEWAKELEKILYAQHDYGEKETLYEDRVTPIGPNFWVRSSLFKEGIRYNESLGPTPDRQKRIMGSETSFLLGLIDKGYQIVYSPEVIVGHYVTPEQIHFKYTRERAASLGRWKALSAKKFKRKRLYEDYPFLWKATIQFGLGRMYAMLFMSIFIPDKSVRIKKKILLHIWIAYSSYYLDNHQEIYQHANRISNYSAL